MSSTFVSRIGFIVAAALFTITSMPLDAQNEVQKIMIGDTKVTVLRSDDGKDKLSKPTKILVYKLDVSDDAITIDKSHVAHILNNGPIAHIKGDAGQKSDPAAVAAKVQKSFSKSLVKGFASGYFALARSRMTSTSASRIDSRKSQCTRKRLNPPERCTSNRRCRTG